MRARTFLAGGLLLLAAGVTAAVLKGHELPALLAWAAAQRATAAVPFLLFYSLAAIILVPDSLLMIAAGAIFGLARGIVLVSLGSTLAAAVVFFLGRSLAREWIRRRAEHWPKFRALNRAIERHGFWVVFLTRLSPVIPFGFLNYSYSVTAVRARDYLLATWLGMLPSTLLYVYIGTAAVKLTELFSGRAPITPESGIVLWVGLALTATVIVLLTLLARRELARELRS